MASSRSRSRIGLVSLLAVLAGLALVWAAPSLMSVVRAELGGIAFERGQRMMQESPSEPNPYLDRALRNYQAAVSWDSGNAYAWRKLGEVYLTLGQNEQAREALTRAVDLSPDSSLNWVLLGDAYDGLGASREALDAWTEGRAGTIRRDRMVVNGIKIADAHVRAGDPLSAVPVLRDEVLALDEGDVYALATLVVAYDSAVEGDHPLADPYRESARYPTEESLRLGEDGRLAGFQAQGAAKLYATGYWDAELVASVLHYWAASAHPAAVSLAEQLVQAEPGREEWRLAYVEALVYAGRPLEALSQIDSMDDSLSAAGLRWRALAQVAQARADGDVVSWDLAREALVAYAEAAPADLWPLAALAEAAGQSGDPDGAARWSAALLDRTEGADQAAVAAGLDLSENGFTLGANMVANGDLESWSGGAPDSWMWSNMATGDPWNLGLYVGGAEPLQALSGSSLRLQGVWYQADPEREVARAGFWLFDDATGELETLSLTPGATYVVSLDYMTGSDGTANAAVWLSGGDTACWKGDRSLAESGGQWRHLSCVCGPASEGDDPLQPLLRLFGTGTVLYDNLEIREVVLADGRGKG